MKIEERVETALNACSEKRWDQALDVICPAIEATARKDIGKNKISGKQYKDFLRSKYSLLERFSLTGLNMETTKFPNLHIETDDDKILVQPDVADIVYHCYRNASQHGHEISDKFVFSEQQKGSYVGWKFNFDEGRIHFPTNLVFALIAVVVLSSANKEITSHTGSHLWLDVDGHQVVFAVGLFWGGEDLVERFFQKHPAPRVEMKLSEDRK